MENLIKKLAKIKGMNEEMVIEVLMALSNHSKEQFPLLHNCEDSIFEAKEFSKIDLSHTQFLYN